MNDTPRTDDLTKIPYGVTEGEVIDYHALLVQMTHHARQLERELSEAQKRIGMLTAQLKTAYGYGCDDRARRT